MEETVGEVLRRLRLARGLSLRQLGNAVPVDFALLSRIENGKQFPSAPITKAIDAALGADGELVLTRSRDDSSRPRARVASEDMRRRALLTGTAGAAVAGVLPERLGARARLGVADVDELQRRVTRLYAMDFKHGGEGLWRNAVGYAEEANRWLDQATYTPGVGRRLLSVAARMHMCAGWLAADAGRQDVARSCYIEALGQAKQADDVEVETHALANLALQANVLGNPRQALRWAEASERAAARPGGHSRLRVIPQLRLARAYALSGRRADFERAMVRARTQLGRADDRPVERWCSFLTEAEVDGIEGTSTLEMGQHARAVRLLGRAVDGHGDEYARSRALYRTRLACAKLRADRDVEAAARLADSALDDLADTVDSWRVARELDLAVLGLAPYRSVPAVEAFLTRRGSHSSGVSRG